MSLNKILDRDIQALHDAIEVMIEETKIQYASTFEVLKTSNYELAKRIMEHDKEINRLENSFTTMALWKISKQQMVAGNLRLAVGSILIAREIERIADYAKILCRYFINYQPTKTETECILQMFELVIFLLDTISHLFNNYDKDETDKAILLKTKINGVFKDLFALLFKRIRSAATDEEALIVMNSVKQLKNLERAGDHLVAVQEIVTFIRTGEFKEMIEL